MEFASLGITLVNFSSTIGRKIRTTEEPNQLVLLASKRPRLLSFKNLVELLPKIISPIGSVPQTVEIERAQLSLIRASAPGSTALAQRSLAQHEHSATELHQQKQREF
jgi:hypothetical protein